MREKSVREGLTSGSRFLQIPALLLILFIFSVVEPKILLSVPAPVPSPAPDGFTR